METQKNKNGKKGIVLLLDVAIMAFIYFFTGFFVVQPIGAIPEGVTIWYFRNDINLPFISSPDGIMLEKEGHVNLLGRAIILSSVMDSLEGKRICNLPYQKWMYKISTKGQEFEK